METFKFTFTERETYLVLKGLERLLERLDHDPQKVEQHKECKALSDRIENIFEGRT